MDIDLRAGVGEMFNDAVTFVDYPGELERREIEVLIRLVPFVERDVEERCAKMEEEREEEMKRIGDVYFDDSEKWVEAKRGTEERYEEAIREENERVVRLRRAILERAGRLFPELAAGEEPQEDFSSSSHGEGGSLPARERESASGVSYVAGVVPGSWTEVP